MHFNYIFSGAGLAGLMTLIKMAHEGVLENKSIVIIDPSEKTLNDRTWCFWEKSQGSWNHLLSHQWEKAFFINHKEKIECLKGEYVYKMIESQSFYRYAKEELKRFNVKWIKEEVVSFEEVSDKVIVKTTNAEFTAEYLFNSILDLAKIQNNSSFPLLQQHFVGWFVKTEKPIFNPSEAVFMDFSVEQNQNTRFMYVLPRSTTEALIEYTLFSSNLLVETQYEKALEDYLSSKGIENYSILAKERGNIPMTTFPFWDSNTNRILNIGSAGGWTKASTGYTFKNTDKETQKLIAFLKQNWVSFKGFKSKTKYTFYDDLFVKVLFAENQRGYELFSSLFCKGKPKLIFKFLDEETSLLEDLKVILRCPKKPFLKALFKM